MDSAAIIALALGILLFLLQYAVRDMPWWITWPGIAICVAVIVWKGNFVQVSHTSAIPQIVMVIGAFALAFGTLLYLDQKRTSPSEQQDDPDILATRGQLKFVDPIFKRDIRKGTKTLERAQVSIVLRNDAPIDIQYTVNDFKVRIQEKAPQNPVRYPNRGPVLQPGQTITYEGDKVELDGAACGIISGEYSFDIVYGPPGHLVHPFNRKMRFTITLDDNCNIAKQEWSWIVE